MGLAKKKEQEREPSPILGQPSPILGQLTFDELIVVEIV